MLGNRCSLVAWLTNFSVCLSENKAISAFNLDIVEVEAELGNTGGVRKYLTFADWVGGRWGPKWPK